MELARQVTFRDIDPLDSISSHVEKRIEKLETFHPRISSCHVTLSAPHRHRQHGRHYRVSIDVKVPGANLVIGHGDGDERLHEDLHAAVDEAFELMKRALKANAQKQRGDVKTRAIAGQPRR